MPQILATSDSARVKRRSTRINKSVPVTIMAVDSQRGPYREDVSTVAVSCHGFRYKSKHDMPMNSSVILELAPKENEVEAVSAKGLVKWVKRPEDSSGVFETAIELEKPANLWGIDMPPQDWVKFCETGFDAALNNEILAALTGEAKPVSASDEKSGNGNGAGTHALATNSSAPLPDRPLGLLVGQFHEQMERILFEAAQVAVRERVKLTLDEVRDGLRDEAKRVLSEVAASQAGPWMNQALKQLNTASLETTKTVHAAWTKRLETEIRAASERVEERGREFDVLAQSLSANALERFQRRLESSRDRVVTGIEEKSSLAINNAKEATADLEKKRDELKTLIDQSFADSKTKIEQLRSEFQGEMELAIHDRLESARGDLEGVIRSVTSSALESFGSSAQDRQSEAQAQLRDAIQRISEEALREIKEKASISSREFSREMNDRSRAQLEFVSSSIAEAAKTLQKLPGE